MDSAVEHGSRVCAPGQIDRIEVHWGLARQQGAAGVGEGGGERVKVEHANPQRAGRTSAFE